MRTETIKIYDINEMKELFPEAYKKILERFNDFNVDYSWWDYVFDMWDEDLAKYGMKTVEKDTEFNVGYPGDYLNLAVDVEDPRKLMEYIKEEYPTDWKDAVKKATELILDEDPETATLEEDIDDLIHDDVISYGAVGDESESGISEALDYILKEESRKFLNGLSEQYEYLLSDEAIHESLEANDFEFMYDGRTW